MQTLTFIRHAKSDWANSSISDIQRPLNERGYRDAQNMSLLLKEKHLSPDLIISSPAIRAYSTALIFSLNFNYPVNKIMLSSMLYESSTNEYIQVIKKLDDSFNTIFLFGHNPVISDVAAKFSEKFQEEMPTCGIVSITKKTKFWKHFMNAETESFFFDFPKKYFNTNQALEK